MCWIHGTADLEKGVHTFQLVGTKFEVTDPVRACEIILTLLVKSRNGPNPVIGKCAEDLNDGFLVSAHSGNGVVKFLGVEVR